MKKYQTTLLASVAALAFAAGISLASAQGQGKDHAAGPQSAQPQATQPAAGEGPAKETAAEPQGEAKPTGKGGPAAAAKPAAGAKPATAAGAKPAKEHAGKTAQKATPGKQTSPNANAKAAPAGNAKAAGNVKLSEQQRTQIRNTVINGGNAPRVTHVNFDLKIGVVVPRADVQPVAVPETLVVMEPDWRGLLYFVYEEEIVIVSPDNMAIVAVVAV